MWVGSSDDDAIKAQSSGGSSDGHAGFDSSGKVTTHSFGGCEPIFR